MRVLVTIICLLAARALAYLPLLGVHYPEDRSHFHSVSMELGGAYSAWANASNFALLPAFTAIFLVSLVILLVPSLRRQTIAGTAAGWREWVVVIWSVPLAIVFGYIFFHQMRRGGTPYFAATFPFGTWLPVLHMTMVSLGMTLFAVLINKKGWGNGFVLIPATAVLLSFPYTLQTMWDMFIPKGDIPAQYSIFHLIGLGLICLIAIGVTIILTRLWRSERAEPAHGQHAMELFLALLIGRALIDYLLWFSPLAILVFDIHPSMMVLLSAGFSVLVVCLLVATSPRAVNAHLIPMHRSIYFWIVVLGMTGLMGISTLLANKFSIPYVVSSVLIGFGPMLITGCVVYLMAARKPN